MATVAIIEATSATEIEDVRTLFHEYQRQIGVDLCFQDFERELAALPGDYAPPAGRLLLASARDGLAGCVALRRLAGTTCEMKRLFVRPQYQGSGIGRALAERVIADARAAGYATIQLDTLPSMEAAQRLYVRLGFRDAEPCGFNPIAGARFMALSLGDGWTPAGRRS